MSVNCKLCKNYYSTVSNLNKHIKKKHTDVFLSKVKYKVCYTCNYCNGAFDLKKKLTKHITHHINSSKPTNIKCSFDDCGLILRTKKLLASHLETDHNQNIKVESLYFNTMEEFDEWKKQIEDADSCQYVRTSKKQSDTVEYIYFDCHRSYNPRLSSKGIKKSKATVKIGKVCPSHIRIHKKENNIEVQYHSTHLWHTNEIEKLRLHKDDRSKLAEKLSMGIPVQKILNDIHDSAIGMKKKRIHLLKKKDLHNIRKEYNISYTNKHFENDAVDQRKSDPDIPHIDKSNISPITPLVCENPIVINTQFNDIELVEDINDVQNSIQIKNKMKMMIEMYNKSILPQDDENSVLEHCDNILTLLVKNKNSNFEEIEINNKKKIEAKAHFNDQNDIFY